MDTANKIHRSEHGDLFALLRILCQQKWLILTTLFLSLAAAFVYIIFSKPVYEAKVYVSVPGKAQIAELNKAQLAGLNNGRRQQKKSDLELLTPSSAFKTFALLLSSASTQNKFFQSFYYPVAKSDSGKDLPPEFYYEQFKKSLTVKKIPGSNPEAYLVAVRGYNPEQTQKWAKKYMDLAEEISVKVLVNNANRQAREIAESLAQRMQMARSIAREKRFDRITQLEEALAVVGSVGKENYPLEAKNNVTIDVFSSSDAASEQSLMYRRGSKFLQAEINILKQRKSDDPFIPELRKLQNEYHFYNTLRINPEKIRPFRMDGADVPVLRVSPKKTLILVLAALAGLMLSVFFALIRNLSQAQKG